MRIIRFFNNKQQNHKDFMCKAIEIEGKVAVCPFCHKKIAPFDDLTKNICCFDGRHLHMDSNATPQNGKSFCGMISLNGPLHLSGESPIREHQIGRKEEF